MFPKLSLAAVAIAISLITPARAFDQAQIEFVASFAASIVAANRCEGFALNVDEVTFVSSALGIKPEDWKSDQFKEAVKDAVDGVTFKPAFCPAPGSYSDRIRQPNSWPNKTTSAPGQPSITA